MARTELPNGVILPAEYSDDWYEDMTSNLTKLDDVIGSDSEKLNSNDVAFLRMSSAALTDGGTGNFSDLNSSNKLKTGDYVLDSGRKLYQVVSVDSTNERFTVGNSLFKVTAESDLAPVAESGDYDDLDNKPDLNPYDQHIANTDIHVTTADKNRWNTGITQAYVVRYASVAVSDNSTVPYSNLNNTDNIKANDLLLDTNGKIYQISSVDTANETVSVTTPLTQLAVDSGVMHLSGNETVNGTKTFIDMIPIDGDYLGNEASNNQRTNICLRSNRDTAGKSGAYISRFRQNKPQGALQTGDLQMIGFDVLENEVRTNNVFSIQCSGWVDNVPTRVKFISTGSDSTFGSSAKPSKINDINPGALSLPDLSNGIDISGYLDTSQSSTNTYTPVADGWISIKGRSAGTSGIAIIQDGMAQMGYSLVDFGNSDRVSFCALPVKAGVQVEIRLKSVTSLDSAKFFPCLGNV